MKADTLIGMTASLLTIISMLPQLIKLYESKKPVAQSWLHMSIAIMAISLWMVYGLIKYDMVIFGTQAISLIISLNFYMLNNLYLKRRRTQEAEVFLLDEDLAQLAKKRTKRNRYQLHKV